MKIYDAVKGAATEVDPVFKHDEEWEKSLTREQFEVTSHKATERPYTCTLNEFKNDGIFRCVRCGTDLFFSKSKFESGTGWPS
ncbi:MAG TPA: peptide-methionine (R)-S-oxide reductase, partial [Candidatus Omnitrophota bacterium]|nr:peptide-methionine (R)-S-oxide reductase [Candidatus Omnitrophota bacterium]